jgi:putative phosphoesterase
MEKKIAKNKKIGEKIAIISDSHDNLEKVKKLTEFLNKENIKILIHCGDVSKVETIKEILNNFKGKIYLSFGNAEINKEEFLKLSKENKRLKVFNEFGEVKIKNKKIAFCHFYDLALKLAKSKKYNFVFYGHTHKPWEEKIENTKLINPGNLAGQFYPASFAIYDFNKNIFSLKILLP